MTTLLKNHPRPAYSSKHYKAAAALLAVVAAASSASAVQRTWEGNNSTSLSEALNFVGGTAPVSGSDGILFNAAGTQGTSLTLASGVQYSNTGGALVFSATAPAYTISGAGTITMGTGAFVNNGSAVQTINNTITRNTGNPITIGANNGSFVFGGGINLGASGGTLATAFGATTGGAVTFNGNLTVGASQTGNLTLGGGAGSGTVNLNGSANTGLNGTLLVRQNVTLNVSQSTGLDSATAVNLDPQSGSASVTLNNTSSGAISTPASLGIVSTGNLNFGSTNNRNISFTGAAAINADTNRTITISGTGVTVATAGQWNNTTAGTSRTLTVNGAGNTFAVGGIAIAATGDEAINRGLTIAGTGNLTITGGLTNGATSSGLRALTLTGSGTVAISGASNYNNTTVIGSDATLLVNGTHTGGRGYTVNGDLGGTGSIDISVGNYGVVVNEGGRLLASSADSLSFSTGTGVLNISAALGSASPSMLFNLGAPSSTLISANAANIGSSVLNFDDFTFTTTGGFGAGVYTLFDLTSVTGTLGSSLTGTIGGLDSAISFAGSDVILTVSAVPEPSAFAALAGLCALASVGLRRRRRSA